MQPRVLCLAAWEASRWRIRTSRMNWAWLGCIAWVMRKNFKKTTRGFCVYKKVLNDHANVTNVLSSAEKQGYISEVHDWRVDSTRHPRPWIEILILKTRLLKITWDFYALGLGPWVDFENLQLSDMVLKLGSYSQLYIFISYFNCMLNLTTSCCILGIFPNTTKHGDAHGWVFLLWRFHFCLSLGRGGSRTRFKDFWSDSFRSQVIWQVARPRSSATLLQTSKQYLHGKGLTSRFTHFET